MLPPKKLFNAITNAAIDGSDGDISARQETIWNAACVLMADVLRRTDPFNRERLLRGVETELRESIAALDQLLCPLPRTPSKPN